MKKIYMNKATIEDFDNIEIGDWIEGIGNVLSQYELEVIRRFAKAFFKTTGD